MAKVVGHFKSNLNIMESSKSMSQLKTKVNYDIVLNWSVTNQCNFNCPGCIAHAQAIQPEVDKNEIDIQALLRTLKAQDKTFKIVFSGGEPLYIKNIIDVLVELTVDHYIVLITNLTHPKIKEFARKVNPERVEFVKASCHLLELRKHHLLGTFITYFKLLQESGFSVFTEEIAYPVYRDEVKSLKAMFTKYGINLEFQAYRGQWADEAYPKAYTPDDYKRFNFTDLKPGSPSRYNRKNRKCNAGYNAIAAHADGSVYRCYNVPDYLGNLYTGFNLDDALIRCPLKFCDCPLSEFDRELFKKALDECKPRMIH